MSTEASTIMQIERRLDLLAEPAQHRVVHYLVSRYGLPMMTPAGADTILDDRRRRDRDRKWFARNVRGHPSDTSSDISSDTSSDTPPVRVLPVAPVVSEGVGQLQENTLVLEVGGTNARAGVTQEMQSEKSARKKRQRAPRDLSLSGIQAVQFARFWSAYPNLSSKQDAIAAWKRLNPDEALVETILAAIAAQKTWRQWRDGVYPHPATWLNGRRWDDEEPPEGERNSHHPSRTAGNAEAFERAGREIMEATHGRQ